VQRAKKSIDNGRGVGINGRPYYLEQEEIEIFKEELRKQTRLGNFLSLREGSLLVYLFIFLMYDKAWSIKIGRIPDSTPPTKKWVSYTVGDMLVFKIKKASYLEELRQKAKIQPNYRSFFQKFFVLIFI
jgi:hypothetical protein